MNCQVSFVCDCELVASERSKIVVTGSKAVTSDPANSQLSGAEAKLMSTVVCKLSKIRSGALPQYSSPRWVGGKTSHTLFPY